MAETLRLAPAPRCPRNVQTIPSLLNQAPSAQGDSRRTIAPQSADCTNP
jgi:hypothetical protein